MPDNFVARSIDHVNQPGLSPIQPRANIPEHRERIHAIVDSLQPELLRDGVHLQIVLDGVPQSVPTRVKRGTSDIACTHISKRYEETYHLPMSKTAYRQVLKEIQAALTPTSPDIPLPDDLTLIAGTTDIYISLTAGSIYQRKGKSNSVSYIELYQDIPTVHAVYDAPTGAKGQLTSYDVTIAGRRAIITHDEMASGKWREKYPRLQGVGNPHTSGIYLQVLQHLAHTAPLRYTVTHTGVHKVPTDNGHVYGYMFPTGTFLTTTPDIALDVAYIGAIDLADTSRQLWSDFNQVASTWDTTLALDAIEYIKRITPTHGQGLIALCHQARTLAAWVRDGRFNTGYGLYLYGPSSSGKTSLAIATASIGKPYSYPNGVDATFRDTVTSVETKIDTVGDAPFIIDDVHKAPGDSAYTIQAQEKTLDAIIRSATDREAIRGRMNSNMSRQKTNTVKTNPTITGEYFPSAMATSFMRRTLFVEIPNGCIAKKCHDSPVSLEGMSAYVPGLHKLGRRIILMLLRSVSERDFTSLVQHFHTLHSTYATSLYGDVQTAWLEETLPDYAHSIIDASANILLGAYLIDRVTRTAANVCETLRPFLLDAILAQLRVMGGMYQVDGLTPLDQVLQSLLTHIAEGTPINGLTYKIEDYHTTSDVHISIPTDTGTPYEVQPEQWGMPDSKQVKTIVAYISVSRGTVFLTQAGRDALLALYKTLDGVLPVTTPKALSLQLAREKWLVDQRNGRHLDIPCNPQKKRQIRALPLSLARLLTLIIDTSAIDPLDDETPDSTPSNVTQFPTSNQPVGDRVPTDIDAIVSVVPEAIFN